MRLGQLHTLPFVPRIGWDPKMKSDFHQFWQETNSQLGPCSSEVFVVNASEKRTPVWLLETF